MTPYPNCRLCHKSPWVHHIFGSTLRCYSKGQEGDFGPATALVVAGVFGDIGKKAPRGLVNKILELKRQGITTWEPNT